MFYEFLKFLNVQEQVTSSFKTLKKVSKVSDLPCFRKFSKQVSSFRSPYVRMCRRYKGRLSVGSTRQWSAGILWSLRLSLLCKVKPQAVGLVQFFPSFFCDIHQISWEEKETNGEHFEKQNTCQNTCSVFWNGPWWAFHPQAAKGKNMLGNMPSIYAWKLKAGLSVVDTSS